MSTSNRTCAAPGCSASLEGRRPQTRTCSRRCRVRLHRERQRGVEPWEISAWLDPAALVAWIDAEWSEETQVARLNGSARSLRRWRAGEVGRVHIDAAEDAVDQLGASIRQIPDNAWKLGGAT